MNKLHQGARHGNTQRVHPHPKHEKTSDAQVVKSPHEKRHGGRGSLASNGSESLSERGGHAPHPRKP